MELGQTMAETMDQKGESMLVNEITKKLSSIKFDDEVKER